MSFMQRACKTLGALALSVLIPGAVFGQVTNYYGAQAGEFYPDGNPLGDQENPSVAVNSNGGYIVWQDQVTDPNPTNPASPGTALGISALMLDSTFSPVNASFRINQSQYGDQENGRVALLNNGGAVIVWQGGVQGFQHIYAAVLSSRGTLVNNGDILVNTATNYQSTPAVAVLSSGNIIVTWASLGQDNSDGFQGVYGQILSPTGAKVGGEFQINQFTPYNQRNPSVAAMPGGNFVVTWISEQQTSSQSTSGGTAGAGYNSVDVFARIYNSNGVAQVSEFRVNTSTNACQQPGVAVASDGSYTFVWSQLNSANYNYGWDIYSRPFSSTGTGGAVNLVNSQLYGNQYQPRIAAAGTDFMIVWTSQYEDGSQEGVYSQFIRNDGTMEGSETLVNTTTLNRQWHPDVASDGTGRFLATWSSYMGYPQGMDLGAQRYNTTLQPLSPPSTPTVLPLELSYLSVTWPPVVGFSVNYYNLYIDGASPVEVGTNHWSNATNYSYYFQPNSSHTFQLSYVLMDGRVSPLSGIATNTAMDPGNFNTAFIPVDWLTKYFGSNSSKWPSAYTVLAPGVTVEQVFEWGASPTDPTTWLKQSITRNSQGYFLNWNTVQGGIYQVMYSATAEGPFANYGSPRFAAGTSDAVYIGTTGQGFFKLVRNRY